MNTRSCNKQLLDCPPRLSHSGQITREPKLDLSLVVNLPRDALAANVTCPAEKSPVFQRRYHEISGTRVRRKIAKGQLGLAPEVCRLSICFGVSVCASWIAPSSPWRDGPKVAMRRCSAGRCLRGAWRSTSTNRAHKSSAASIFHRRCLAFRWFTALERPAGVISLTPPRCLPAPAAVI